jgi:hypothetical protein
LIIDPIIEEKLLSNSLQPNYHGSTSRFHAQVAQSETEKLVDPQEQLSERTRNKELQVFYSNAELLKVVWEPLAYTKLDQDPRFSPKTASMLMKIYWTWQHPLHNWVYRPCEQSPIIPLYGLANSY